MNIKRYIGGSLESNGYVIYRNDGKKCFIIDPGYSPERFLNFVKDNELECEGIILTHLHDDHTGAAEAVSRRLNCPIMMHEMDGFTYSGHVDRMLKDKETLDLEGELLTVLHTPGHTRGSICIYSDKSRVAFTGDTLFDTDLGRTDLPGGDESEMIDSIKNVIDKWENDIVIYPGHDNGCNMKAVRKNNIEFNDIIDGGKR